MSASPQIQFIWGRLEDKLRRFGERDPAKPHRDFELVGEEAIKMGEELVAQVRFELAEYRAKKQVGD